MKSILFLFVALGLMTSGCCVLKMDNASAELMASGGGACVITDDDDNNSESTPLFGTQIGGFLVLDPEVCAGDFSFAAGLLYSTRGYSSESEFSEGGGDGMEPINYSQKSTLRTHYLDVPIVARYPISERFSVYAGPQASFLLGAKRTYEVNDMGENSEKGTDGLNSVDLGITAGVQYHMNNGMQVGVGIDQGFRDVFKSEYGSSKSKNQVIKATVGLNLNKFKNRDNRDK